MRYFSTFSGIGGFELGIQQAYESNNELTLISEKSKQKKRSQGRKRATDKHGVQLCTRSGVAPLCVGYSEIDKYAIQIYQKYFPKHKAYGDITKINEVDLPDFDMLVGGFPCQAFSIAGKRMGFEESRGTLFFEIARIIRKKQPRLLLLENVKGLLSHDKGRTFHTIICTLDELGYDIQWQVLNSKNHGVPQNRERVFIIGHLRGTRRPEVFPFGDSDEEDTRNTGEDLSYCLDANYHKGTSTLEKGRQQLILDEEIRGLVKKSRPNEKEIGITYKPNGDIRPHRLDPKKSGISELAINNAKNPSNTLSATHSPKIYKDDDVRIRRLTPTECERLQGFPDGWTEGVSDTQRYKTLGNAVTVNVVRDIMIDLK